MNTRQSTGRESGGNDFAREHLAERSNVIISAGSDFSHCADTTQQFVQILEVSAEVAVKFSKERSAKQLSGSIVVAFAQRPRHFQSSLAITTTGSFSHGEK